MTLYNHFAAAIKDRPTELEATLQCIAPDGVACVWSPDVMPGYWEEA